MDINIKLKSKKNDNSSKIIKQKQKNKFLPDNYYSYDIHKHLKTDFHNIQLKKNEHLHFCYFMIAESKPNKIIDKPFILYLLYKYPCTQKICKNLCVFPFIKYQSGEINEIAKKYTHKIFDDFLKPIGYIKNKNGIFLFYNIHFTKIVVTNNILQKKSQYLWTTMDEICNHRKILTFPIHKTVSYLFYKNPKLIYLKNKEKLCIESPTIAYVGATHELLNYISTLGIKSSAVRTFGPYYYFTDLKQAIRYGGWSSNYEKSIVFDKSITDENGKYIQGGIVRFALFLGNNRVILDRKQDDVNNYIKFTTDNDNLNDKQKEFYKKNKGKWTKSYDSLIISNYKQKNTSGYFWSGTGYILKSFNFFTSLSTHLIDKSTLKPNWDPDYKFYNIK
tara:strand:- start:790 stop:1959 length:1170 start_codon:yes stop_codon:yes gene_type:complete